MGRRLELGCAAAVRRYFSHLSGSQRGRRRSRPAGALCTLAASSLSLPCPCRLQSDMVGSVDGCCLSVKRYKARPSSPLQDHLTLSQLLPPSPLLRPSPRGNCSAEQPSPPLRSAALPFTVRMRFRPRTLTSPFDLSAWRSQHIYQTPQATSSPT